MSAKEIVTDFCKPFTRKILLTPPHTGPRSVCAAEMRRLTDTEATIFTEKTLVEHLTLAFAV